MHSSVLVCFALALTSCAVPLARHSANSAIQRKSVGYDVVNVGAFPNAPQRPVVETAIETVTVPGASLQTVTVTQTPTHSPSPSPLWGTIVHGSASTLPTPSATPVTQADTMPRGFTAMDRLARAFGKSISSHFKPHSNETLTTYSKLKARGANGTEYMPHFLRGLLNSTES
ncbi:uncharacterized protein BJX67DRAFT_380107 [Aspergillus lucknowensis]|uniref:Uncharacterized protein n=1 Tax=Aspergillus lucknowensis TaxID=176173 RepID=A0ABR4LUS4_9EURO